MSCEHVTALLYIKPFSYLFDFILFCHTPFIQCLFFTSSRILNLSNLLWQRNETHLSFMSLYIYEDFSSSKTFLWRMITDASNIQAVEGVMDLYFDCYCNDTFLICSSIWFYNCFFFFWLTLNNKFIQTVFAILSVVVTCWVIIISFQLSAVCWYSRDYFCPCH